MSTFSIFGSGSLLTATPRSAVERYFETALYLLIVTGFATLASTGKLDLLSLAFVTMALLVRGHLLLRAQSIVLSRQATDRLTVVYFLLYAADFFLLSREFVTATVHLVLFAMVVKIFSAQRHRDHMYLAGLSFGMVLMAAILTVDSLFLAGLTVFMLIAVATFTSLEMKRSGEAAARQAREVHDVQRRMAVSLTVTAVALMFAIAVGATVIFFILPRVSTRYLSSFAHRNDLVTGFSDDVKLGDIGEIKQSNVVVMHIQIDGDTRGAFDLKWRGVALTLFDGTRWSNPPQQLTVHGYQDGAFDLTRPPDPWDVPPRKDAPYRFLRYRVVMEPIGTNVFFVAPKAYSLYGGYREVSTDAGRSIYNSDRDRMITAYRASSNIYQPAPEALRSATGEAPPQLQLRYLQLPGIDPRIRALAEQVTANATTNYDRVTAVEEHLRSQYGYTLTLLRRPVKDPLAHFLFERREGHCEYFASAMAVMLRSLGIPARVVNGFRTGEFNSITGSYIIRARDAHSWVEVFFPQQGWVTFDPTPPDPKLEVTSWSRLALYVDAMREFWREWVINYDFGRQTALSNTAISRSRVLFDRTRMKARVWYERLLEQARRTQENATRAPERFGAGGFALVGAVILLANAGRLWRLMREHWLASRPERAPRAAASIWYERMARRVARRGWRKQPTQTPREFVVTIDDPHLRRRVADFTERYERARFGESRDDASMLPELFEALSRKD